MDIHNPNGNCENSACSYEVKSTGATLVYAPEYLLKSDDSSKTCVRLNNDKAKMEDESCSSNNFAICSIECGGSKPAILRTRDL